MAGLRCSVVDLNLFASLVAFVVFHTVKGLRLRFTVQRRRDRRCP